MFMYSEISSLWSRLIWEMLIRYEHSSFSSPYMFLEFSYRKNILTDFNFASENRNLCFFSSMFRANVDFVFFVLFDSY